MKHGMNFSAVASVVIVMSGSLLQQATADPLRTWCYEGIFTTVSVDYLNAGLRIGDPLYGGFRFDKRTPDLTSDPKVGTYLLESSFVYVPALGAYWTFDGSGVGKAMTVISATGVPTPYDFFEVYQRDTPLDSSADPTKLFYFNGRAPAGALFDSDALPNKPPPVSSFEFLNFQYTNTAVTPYNSAAGTVTKLYAARPSTASLRSDCGAPAE